MNLSECKREMRSIVAELRDIESGIRHDFTGIGEQLCGNCIDKIADKYEGVSRKLDNVSSSQISALINESKA